jgi:outer membrane protein assembly factor BamE (lipoprotein component of BamABCDE complex)
MNFCKLILVLFSGIIFINCSGSSLRTAANAEKNKINMLQVRLGMSKTEVTSILGEPSKTEKKYVEEKEYDVWYYLTKGTELGQSTLITSNYTPFIFSSSQLIAWGHPYYKYIFNVDNAKDRHNYDKSQSYTDDRDEWPPSDHIIIKPPSVEKKQKPKTNEKKVLEKAIKQTPKKSTKVKPKQTPKQKPTKKKDGPCKDMGADSKNYHWWE